MVTLVTGSKGFVGSHLIPILKKTHKVVEWDIADGKDIFDDKIEDAIKKADAVIHLAASTNVNRSFSLTEEVMVLNVLGTARIAAFCAKYRKKLVYPSSAAFYYPDLSPYAKSKYLAEEIIKPLMSFTPVTVLRFFNIFGPNMNPNSGSAVYNFLTEDKIVVYGDGEQTRDYIHIRDIVSVIVASLSSKWNGKVVDVGTGQAYSMNYVAGIIAKFRNKKIEYQLVKREIKWSLADTQMLKTLYKKPLTTNLPEDLRELCGN